MFQLASDKIKTTYLYDKFVKILLRRIENQQNWLVNSKQLIYDDDDLL